MENISVSVRVRPLSKQEAQDGNPWRIDGGTIFQAGERQDTKYTLDHIFGPGSTTRQIYDQTTHSLIAKVVNGFNSTVFAYGQTSSGKTFTMRGGSQEQEPGLIPLAVHEVFSLIEASQDREYLLRVSYTELYNEEVNDLLAPENTKLPIHESKENGIYVCGLREDIVTSPEQVLALLQEGESNRHTGSTKMNEQSSRSHTLFRMVVESRARGAESESADGAILVSTLTLVDLAGSERVAKTGAEGIRMKEGTAINKSLLTLGNVINKLAEGAQVTGGHIPYRDSKLTRILQPSLGGNAKTAIICAMTPAACHAEESHSTLRFASRAKRVVNNAVVNEVLSDAAVLKRQAREIEELKRRLGPGSGNAGEVNEEIAHLRAQMLRSEQEMQLMRIKLEEEKAEREKAQKQAELAKKIMLERGAGAADGEATVSRRGNRRETWCPGGKGGWMVPPGLDSAGGLSGLQEEDVDTGASSGRKRPLSRLEGAEARSSLRPGRLLEQLDEEDEEEQQDEGPTPQRPRRDRRSGFVDGDNGGDMEGDAMVSEVQRLVAVLPIQNRQPVEALMQRWREMQLQNGLMQRELDDVSTIAQTHQDELRSAEEQLEAAVEENAKMGPLMEQLKWQLRQMQKKAEEVQAAHNDTIKDRDGIAASLEALAGSAQSREQELLAQSAGLGEERDAMRETVQRLTIELADVRGQLELQIKEKSLFDGKQKAQAAELAEMEAKLEARLADGETLKRQLQVCEERVAESDARSRELYECNQRLEAHVHDLESRKRAPLYQKKQEEELRAAVEKAAEAEVRAHDAELRAKEMKAAAEAAEKQTSELAVQLQKLQKESADALSDLAEKHDMEMQKLGHEHSLVQAGHDNQMQSMQAKISEMDAACLQLGEQLAGREAHVKNLEATIAELKAASTEQEAAQAELQACATAAAERITHLEEAAEATQLAHEQELAAAKAELEQAVAKSAASASRYEQQLLEAQAAAEAKVEASAAEAQAQREAAAVELQTERERSKQLVLASMEECQRLSTAKEEVQKRAEALQAKVNEAAGALKAKEELKEERMKHKQEMSTVKAELHKLQLESKTGSKGKELATKELEGLKKKLLDVEGKLKVVASEKQAAVAEKAALEKQLKQQQGQKLLIEKSLEKKDQIENKKRESIMINLNKSKDQLNSTEERLKQGQVEIQKLQMDLMAKKGECSGLEEQVAELESTNGRLTAEVNQLSLELTTAQHHLGCLQQEHSDVQGQLQASSEELAGLQEEHARCITSLSTLQAEHIRLVAQRDRIALELEALQQTHAQLASQHAEASEQLMALSQDHAVLKAAAEQEVQELQATAARQAHELAASRAAFSASEDARIAAEGRLPELEELQKLLASTNEELTDLQFKLDVDAATAVAREQELLQQVKGAQEKIQETEQAKSKLQSELQAATATVATLTAQLDDALELYNIEQEKATRHASLGGQASEQVLQLQQQASELQSAATEQAARLQERISELEAAVKLLEKASTASKAALRSACEEAELAKVEAANTVTALQNMSAQRDHAVHEKQVVCEAAEATAQQLLSARNAEVQLRKELEEVGLQLAQALSTVQDLRQEHHQKQQVELASALSDSAAAATEVASLRQQLSAVVQEMNEGQFNWDQEKAVAAMQLQQLRSRVEELEGQAAAELEAARKLQARLAELEQQAQIAQAVNAGSDVAEVQQQQLAALQMTLAAKQQEVDNAVGEVRSLQARVEELQLQPVDSAEVVQLRARLVEVESMQQVVQADLATKVNTLQWQLQQQQAGAARVPQLESEVEQLQAEIKGMEAQVRALQATLSVKQHKADHDAEELRVVSAHAETQTRAVAALTERLGQLQRELEAVSCHREEGSLSERALAAQVEQLQQQLAAAEAASRLRGEATPQEPDMAALLVQVEQLQQQLAAAEADARAGQDQAHSLHQSEQQQQQAAPGSRLEQLEAEVAELQALSNRVSAEKAQVERDMAMRLLELEADIIALQDQLAQANSAPVDMQVDAPTTAGDADADASEHAPALLGAVGCTVFPSAQVAQLAREAALTAELAELQVKVAELEAALVDSQTAAAAAAACVTPAEGSDRYQHELTALHRRCTELDAALNDSQAALAAAMTAAVSAGQDDTALRVEVQELRSSCAQLEAALAAAEAATVVRQDREVALIADLGAKQAALEEVQEQESGMEAAREAGLRAALASAQNREAELAAALEEQRGTCSRLAAEVETLKQQVVAVEQTGSAEAQELLELNTQLEQQVQLLQQQMQRLEQLHSQQLAEQQQQQEGMASQLEQANGQRSRMEERLQEAAQQLEQLVEQHAVRALEVDCLQTRLEEQSTAHGQSLQMIQEELQLATARAEAQANLAAALNERVQQLQQELGSGAAARNSTQATAAAEAMLADRLAQQRQAMQQAADAQAEQHTLALEEVQWESKAKEAELNARLLSLESQIHWLTEQNTQLQADARAAAAAAASEGAAAAGTLPGSQGPASEAAAAEAAGLRGRCSELEQELRKARRAEQKLQALLYRLRKDVSESNGNLAPLLDGLQDLRSLQYDVDLLTQKAKRYERHIAQLEAERQGGGMPLQQQLNQTPLACTAVAADGAKLLDRNSHGVGVSAKPAVHAMGGRMGAAAASGSIMDKENQGPPRVAHR